MSLEVLKKTILDEARERAQEVQRELQEHIDAEKKRIANRARSIEEVTTRNAEREGMQRARRIRQEAELEGRANVLQAKQEELQHTKQLLKRHLLALNEDETRELLTQLLSLVPDTPGTIAAGAEHAQQLTSLIGNHLTIADAALPDEGGFVYQSKETDLNVTISHLVDQLFTKHRAEIAHELFT